MRTALLMMFISMPTFADILVSPNFEVKKGSCIITDVEDGNISSIGEGMNPVRFFIEGSKPSIVIEHMDIQSATKLENSDLTFSFNLGPDKSFDEMLTAGVDLDLKEDKENEVLIQSKQTGGNGIAEIYFDVTCD
ncbi:hypothetical protein [Vibrio ishigakensis]|nr:hypothetical protein [Vibrio ishigakensis]